MLQAHDVFARAQCWTVSLTYIKAHQELQGDGNVNTIKLALNLQNTMQQFTVSCTMGLSGMPVIRLGDCNACTAMTEATDIAFRNLLGRS